MASSNGLLSMSTHFYFRKNTRSLIPSSGLFLLRTLLDPVRFSAISAVNSTRKARQFLAFPSSNSGSASSEKILAVEKWPTNNFREKKRQAVELKRLQGIMGRRYNQWQAEGFSSPVPV